MTATTGQLRYVTGDATRPPGTGPRVIAHIVNDAGKWGAGFSGAVSRRWPLAETAYRAWHGGNPPGRPFGLGGAQVVCVDHNVWVANLVGQRGIRARKQDGPPPVRYEAINEALGTLAAWTRLHPGVTVHMPRIGTGLAGGRWDRIEPLIKARLVDAGIDVTVYDLTREQQR